MLACKHGYTHTSRRRSWNSTYVSIILFFLSLVCASLLGQFSLFSFPVSYFIFFSSGFEMPLFVFFSFFPSRVLFSLRLLLLCPPPLPPPRLQQAEDEHISIVPNFNSNVLHFLNGDFGPFHSNLAIDVPLWLALALKERRKCRIEAPMWMSIDMLKVTLAEEKTYQQQFSG